MSSETLLIIIVVIVGFALNSCIMQSLINEVNKLKEKLNEKENA